MACSSVGFPALTLEKLFKGKWQSRDMKVSKDAIKVSAELLRIFVLEALERSASQERYLVVNFDKTLA